MADIPSTAQCACLLSPGGIAVYLRLCFVLSGTTKATGLMLGPGQQTMNSKPVLRLSNGTVLPKESGGDVGLSSQEKR